MVRVFIFLSIGNLHGSKEGKHLNSLFIVDCSC